jgi:uncharacterized membrane protein
MSIPPTENPYSSNALGAVAPEDRTLGLVAYILAIFTSWLGPLILWLVKKDQSKFVAYHAFQALMLMGSIFFIDIIVSIVVSHVLNLPLIGGAIGFVLGLGALVLNIIAAIAANKGEWYEMPLFGQYARRSVGM